MNEKESLILHLVKEDPFISQIDLAEQTGLSRSAAAGYVSSLIRQGKILGRAYVLPDEKEVICIGGANVDRKIQVIDKLEYGTSNPGYSSQSCGGVARNIAENLGRIGIDAALMTVVGDDHQGQWLLDYTKAFVDIGPSQQISKKTTGTYTAVLERDGEMAVALADMCIYDAVSIEMIEKKWGYLASAELVILDTNFPADVLAHTIKRCEEESIPLCITPVSSAKVKKLPRNLSGVTWLIANQREAEALSGVKIQNEGDFFKSAEAILEKGAKKVVITRGDKGLVYFSKQGEAGVLLPPKVAVDDVTGAGDSLVAGIAYGHLKGLNIKDACKIGMTCSQITLQSHETVNPALNHTSLQEAFKQFFK
ncbi:carbohydrate kinase [Bacillus sp. V33-4]|uniref:carbohydrate kinase n=1 Tax=Bacillus sp. V33-4 TaxID=2054169 RepID=UPI000C784F55|nr:carbohydrate kinase [Bacillus sp. V33-4]PLR87056.1 sugar kinase [Bacillus sp. V33-4]